MDAATALVDLFQYTKLSDAMGEHDYTEQLKAAEAHKDALLASGGDHCADKMSACLGDGAKSVFIRFLLDFAKQQGGKPSTDAMFAAIWVTLGWGGMKSKKITKNTLVRLPWYSRIYSTIVGVAASADRHGEDNLCGSYYDLGLCVMIGGSYYDLGLCILICGSYYDLGLCFLIGGSYYDLGLCILICGSYYDLGLCFHIYFY